MRPTALSLCLLLPLLVCIAGCERPASELAEAALPAGEPVVVSFAVDGMHCGGCAEALRKKIAGIAGVTECEVSFEERSAVVSMASSGLLPRVTETITRLGYTTEVLAEETASTAADAPAADA